MKHISVIWISIMLALSSGFTLMDIREGADGITIEPNLMANSVYNINTGEYFTEIQTAIDDTDTVNGHTLEIYNGTYNENVVVDKSISLIGEDKNNTIIAGWGLDAISITADGVNVSGVKLIFAKRGIIINSKFSQIFDIVSTDNDYGIVFKGPSAYCKLNHSIISNNKYLGISIEVNTHNLTISNNEVLYSRGEGNIRLYGSRDVMINNNLLVNDNQLQSYGYGFYIEENLNITLENNTMIDCGIMITAWDVLYWNELSIDTTNTVNGKPVYYWKSIDGGIVPPGAGEVILGNCTNVTVQNQNISGGCSIGVLLGLSNNNFIVNNNCTDNLNGISLRGSDNNTIEGNNVSNNVDNGMSLAFSNRCVISNNTMNNNSNNGIGLTSSNNVTIQNNSFSDNRRAIQFYGSVFNSILENFAFNCDFYLGDGSDDNLVANNTLSNDVITLKMSANNTISNNTMNGYGCGIIITAMSVNPITIFYWNTHNIDDNNTINGKPVYYWKNKIGGQVPSGAGQVILANCTNVDVINQDLSNGSINILVGHSSYSNISSNEINGGGRGIYSVMSSNNSINNNMFYNCSIGMWLRYYSSYNSIYENEIVNDRGSFGGLVLDTWCTSNIVYHNNFINNSNPPEDWGGNNLWNLSYPLGGNYWSDYTGVDYNSTPTQNIPPPDGIGDTPYTGIGGGKSALDHYPLMGPRPIPLANAGPDQVGPPHTQVTFNGSSSFAFYGITNYWWNFTDGIPKTLTGVSPSYTFDNESIVVVTLEVMDTKGQKDTDTMIVNITDMNPVANAGPDQMVPQHTLVIFNGSASTDDMGITNYWWNFTDGIPKTLTGVSPTYNFDNESTYIVRLEVMDTKGQVGEDTLIVNVTDSDPPVANAGPDQQVMPKVIMTFDGTASYDPGHLGEPIIDGITNWTWTFDDGTGPQTIWGPSPTHQFNISGVFLVTLTVRDNAPAVNGGPYQDNDTMTVTVIEMFDIDIMPAAGSNDWILISFPNKVSGDPLVIVQDALDAGGGFVTWDIVQTYNATLDEWLTTSTFKPPSLNTFDHVDNTMSFWLHISDYGDGIMTIPGVLATPGEQVILPLKAGWNLIGYPFPNQQDMFNTFGMLTSMDRPVEVYDPTDPYRLRTADIMIDSHEPGGGYWVHLAMDEDLWMWCPP